ncbi:MAG: TolB family protein [Polyangiaceae bacterium]
MARASSLVVCAALAVVVACVSGACTTIEPQQTTFFDQTIAPVLQTSCVRTNTGVGCHVSDVKGNAFGNLDLTSYAGVDRRHDLLLDYGPYLQPSLLVKNVPPYQLTLQLWDGTKTLVTTDIKHTGGQVLDPTASSYLIVRQWIENGATIGNTGVPPVNLPRTPCSDVVPQAAGFDPNNDPATADFPVFTSTAAPVLQTCAAGNCHGTSVNALYLTCGTSAQEVRWNYFAAVNYLAATPEEAEIVRRPLATSQGGSYHEGGPLFASVNDPGYVALVLWAQKHGPPNPQNLDPAFIFFAQMVQPMLAKKGCMMAQCHSAGMFHDFRLRGGSAGSFALTTTQKNYVFAIAQMSFESDDVSASRLVRKNLYRPVLCGANGVGITHRGGPLFEDFSSQLPAGTLCAPATYGMLCDQADYSFDPAHADKIPAYCVIREWHRRERAERALSPMSEIVYVSKPIPAAPDRPQDFDVFAGGGSLHLVSASIMAGAVQNVGADMAVDLTTCGLAATADVRHPAVSWDAKTIAFAARSTASDALAVYTMNADGTGCAKQSVIANHAASGNGLLEHDFDPAFSPPGPDGTERIVFASTRGNLDSTAFNYMGPQRTPEDPTKPNANLYVLEPDPNSSTGAQRVRQLTWQLNMERLPSFMQDGRLIFTTEKREPGFYELALRRQNLDGGDYHPLYSQRATIGYTQATYGVELAHKDFATIFSDQTALHGAGTIAVFNRSIGPDFTSMNAKDYLVDPTVIVPGSPSALEPDFFLHSLEIVASDGSYTSPSPLPDGQMLVSFGTGAPSSFGGDYDVYALDPASGAKTRLLGNAGTAEVEAVAVYPRAPKGIFASALDEPNGHTTVIPDETTADVTVLDMTVLGSLLFQNTDTGRVLEPDLKSFDVYEDLPPDVTSFPSSGTNTATDAYGKVYVRRRLRGTIPVADDGSAHFVIPGGMPMVLHLSNTSESQMLGLPRWQREEMTFVPGEQVHQGFPSVFFNGLCAGCHGSISGRPVDFALNPDFLTEASSVVAVGQPPVDLTGAASQGGGVIGPPFSP